MFCYLTFPSSSIQACDACGCGAGHSGIGLLTNYRSNFIRLSYFNSRYTTSAEHDLTGTDQFEQFEISLRYAPEFARGLKFMAYIPYGKNTRDSDVEHSTVTGFSDIRITALYAILNNVLIGDNAAIYLEAGGGLQLPSGTYNAQIHDEDLPENFNTGRGSIGYIFKANTLYTVDTYGVVFSNRYQVNASTPSGYRYGNLSNLQMTFFNEFEIKQNKLIPNIGIGYEHVATDTYANQKVVSGTGGNGYFLSASLSFKTENWMAGLSYSMPVSESYSEGEVNAKRRIAFQISHNF